MQDFGRGNQPIAYESQAIPPVKRVMSTTDKELWAVVHALEIWRHHLLGRKFILRTDHSNLRYLQTKGQLRQVEARWLATIQEYTFEVEHIPGKANKAADALSRKSEVEPEPTAQVAESGTGARMAEMRLHSRTVRAKGRIRRSVETLMPDADFLAALREAYERDPVTKHIMSCIAPEGERRDAHPEYSDYDLREGKLYLRMEGSDGTVKFLLYIPDDDNLKGRVLYELHDAPSAGH